MSKNPVSVPFAGDSSATSFGIPGIRNIYRGQFQESVDFSIMKNFHIRRADQPRFGSMERCCPEAAATKIWVQLGSNKSF